MSIGGRWEAAEERARESLGADERVSEENIFYWLG